VEIHLVPDGQAPIYPEKYRIEAEDLFDVLLKHLSGGTYDRLCDKFQMYWATSARESDEEWRCSVCGWHGPKAIGSWDERHLCPSCLATATHVDLGNRF